eukprot:CAMPEP_0173407756 /NCGR_PEP_ID=MMETSP1356-20130122/68014_1 /TAXON_ID=77927 ORGANISM="Hemiselmis virescens, Strain PCC157" /NCGR_SAMPLE_ID=MMETSP1356 /ASSEMBLY_ACC=CAM_ASM_000847 /LENGTH=109 /DNA_ID=CAMNT_0014368979 /DNA_START=308 /DNA_END=634 /DNA_ORIENTATION=-
MSVTVDCQPAWPPHGALMSLAQRRQANSLAVLPEKPDRLLAPGGGADASHVSLVVVCVEVWYAAPVGPCPQKQRPSVTVLWLRLRFDQLPPPVVVPQPPMQHITPTVQR